jgi:hypothetical protein
VATTRERFDREAQRLDGLLPHGPRVAVLTPAAFARVLSAVVAVLQPPG